MGNSDVFVFVFVFVLYLYLYLCLYLYLYLYFILPILFILFFFFVIIIFSFYCFVSFSRLRYKKKLDFVILMESWYLICIFHLYLEILYLKGAEIAKNVNKYEIWKWQSHMPP